MHAFIYDFLKLLKSIGFRNQKISTTPNKINLFTSNFTIYSNLMNHNNYF